MCFEWIRAVGCVAITFLHTFVTIQNVAGLDALSPVRVLVGNLISVPLTRWAVPCFLMVSGALLLDDRREFGWRDVWRYASRMLFVLGTFGLVFCVIESVYDHGGISLAVLREAVVHLLTGQSWGHLWYVYALLGLYLLTPAFRAVDARLSARSAGIALAAFYVVALVMPTALWTQDAFPATPFNLIPAAFYYLLGHFVWRYLHLDAVSLACGGVSLVALVVAVCMGAAVLALPEFCLVAPYSVAIFLIFRKYARRPIRQVPLAAELADRSFGIYLVHPLFLHSITRLVSPLALPAGIYEVLAFAIALVGSYALVGLLKMVPAFAARL